MNRTPKTSAELPVFMRVTHIAGIGAAPHRLCMAENSNGTEQLDLRGPLDTKPGYEWMTYQVGRTAQETRHIRWGKTTVLVTVDIFHLKGFGSSPTDAYDMARRNK